MEFSDKKAGETLTLGFDLVHLLASGETLSGATFSVSVLRGTDPAAASIISGVAQVVGTRVLQHITGGVAGCYYKVQVNATTSAGNTLIERGTLEVTA